MKKRILSILIALVLCFSFMVGCGEEEGDGNTIQKRTFQGTHIYTATETEEYLVKDGKSDYKILLPENYGIHTRAAVDEFNFFFKQATGLVLPVEFESGEGLTHSNTLKYISIGDTKLLASANFNGDDTTENDYDKDQLTKDGVRILTKDNVVFLIGGGDQGNLNAVYDFLQIMFNYEYYYTDCWVIDEGVLNAKLRNFNVTDIPDFEIRDNGWAAQENQYDNTAYRQRITMDQELMPIGDTENGASRAGFHNTNEICCVGPSEWFSDNGDQLCYTAHGDPDKYQELVDHIVKVVISNLKFYDTKNYPEYSYFSITHEDNGSICSCDACMEARNKYGAPVSTVIILCNDVMAQLKAQMAAAKAENAEEASTWIREDMICVFFAYGSFIEPPNTVKDETTGKYVPTHSEMTLRPDVGLYYAMSGMNWVQNVYSAVNDTARQRSEVWFDLAPTTILWTYQVIFSFYVAMHDTFQFFNTDGFTFLASSNPKFIFNQAQYQGGGVTSFQSLKMYLDSKCFWDSSLDTEVLTANYFEAMYGECADIMIKLFNEERMYVNALYDRLGKLDNVGYNVTLSKPEYWAPGTLLKWIDYIDQARDLNERIYKEADPEMYDMINYHLDCEYVFPAYVLVSMYDKASLGADWIDNAKYLKYHIADSLPNYIQSELAGQSGTLNDYFRSLQV